jgi:uncharacterized protein (TIGR03067 family)
VNTFGVARSGQPRGQSGWWRGWPGGAAVLSTRLVALGLTMVAGGAAAGEPSSGEAPAPDDQKASVGRWDVVAVEWDGTPADPEWLARLQVAYEADGSWAVFLKRMPVAEGRSTSRPDVTPKTFEMQTLGSEGIEPTRFHGIYRLDGDSRMLCIARVGTPRPDTFTAPRGSNRMLVTLRRAEKSPPGPVPGAP